VQGGRDFASVLRGCDTEMGGHDRRRACVGEQVNTIKK